MYQRGFSCHQGTTLVGEVDNVGSHAWVGGQEVCGKSPYILLSILLNSSFKKSVKINKVYVHWVRTDGVTIVESGGSLGFLITMIFLQFLIGTKLLGCYVSLLGRLPRACAESLYHLEDLYIASTLLCLPGKTLHSTKSSSILGGHKTGT